MLKDDIVTRIDRVAQNSRANWLGYLSFLVFVGVTLLAHKDSDFFEYGAATVLPIVNIRIPTNFYFLISPILTASLYTYIHMNLSNVWSLLGEITRTAGQHQISRQLNPTVFVTAALWYRNFIRKDGSLEDNFFGFWSFVATLIFGWGLGLLMLFIIWWQSMRLCRKFYYEVELSQSLGTIIQRTQQIVGMQIGSLYRTDTYGSYVQSQYPAMLLKLNETI